MPDLLLLAEHDDGQLKQSTLAAITFAQSLTATLGGSFDILVVGGHGCAAASALTAFGARSILTAFAAELGHPMADRYAKVVAHVARERQAAFVLGGASTFTKDILPRAAALLDAGMLSDVIEARHDNGGLRFRRVMFAGNVVGTVTLEGPIRVLSARPSAFGAPSTSPTFAPISSVALPAEALVGSAQWMGREAKSQGRPDPTEARVIISGGRAIKSAEDFERLIGGLADVLKGAVGSSRALVDAGITPNSLQVGQTGKIVAPDLYVAAGISGAIQHLAGIKDAKVIVAINQDADAPIFEVADFGLVGDVYKILPELTEKLRQ